MGDPYYADVSCRKGTATGMMETDVKGRSYYVCKDFKDDDEHIRHDCITAFEEEIDELKEVHEEL
ncbi:hypothetical protein F2Q69_00036287 [Brassica cretica]|uniref:Uncharacterized protein n=1 Tax=Brassica cretica TaxID=69181 RepID=A0A8S9SPN8_BRACR|nr:hypothetical protein F2Q69_00036287 [Brassica cretica]